MFFSLLKLFLGLNFGRKVFYNLFAERALLRKQNLTQQQNCTTLFMKLVLHHSENCVKVMLHHKGRADN